MFIRQIINLDWKYKISKFLKNKVTIKECARISRNKICENFAKKTNAKIFKKTKCENFAKKILKRNY